MKKEKMEKKGQERIKRMSKDDQKENNKEKGRRK